MGAAFKFHQSEVTRQRGELARFKVSKGADQGNVFVLVAPRAILGRSEECDIPLSDSKASRKHIEIVRDSQGWAFRDLGSANGVLHQGKQVRSGRIRTGEVLQIGETALEFYSADTATQVLKAPPKSIEQLQSDQQALEAQRQRVQALGKPVPFAKSAPTASPLAVAPNASKRKNILILGAVVLIGALFLVEDPGSQPQKKKSAKKSAGDPSSKSNIYIGSGFESTPAAKRSAEMFFNLGFREYREKNYLRAQMQFETALQVAPDHELARRYLQNSQLEIDAEVKHHLENAKRNQNSGQYKRAISHYETVLRLLSRHQTDPNYIESADQIRTIRRILDQRRPG